MWTTLAHVNIKTQKPENHSHHLVDTLKPFEDPACGNKGYRTEYIFAFGNELAYPVDAVAIVKNQMNCLSLLNNFTKKGGVIQRHADGCFFIKKFPSFCIVRP